VRRAGHGFLELLDVGKKILKHQFLVFDALERNVILVAQYMKISEEN
jgi:hypothetical protein